MYSINAFFFPSRFEEIHDSVKSGGMPSLQSLLFYYLVLALLGRDSDSELAIYVLGHIHIFA